VSFNGTSFASQLISRIWVCRFAYVIALGLLCASVLSAQITFVGAQRTSPATGLLGPLGTAVDSSGNLYISDTGNNRIVKITPAGVQTVVSISPLTVGSPQGVAVDGAGNLYISDSSNNRVVKVPAGGGAATVFATVVTPLGLAIDANGNVFVADNEDGAIVKITSGGVKSNFETGLTNPVDVAVDAAGNVYLADASLSSIVKYAAGGGAGSNVGSSLVGISGVAVDGAGNVYVAESGEGAAIVMITPTGTQTTVATNGLASAAYLAVDANYDLFIADQTSNDVIEFSTISVPMGFANVCQGNAPAPCTQTATLQFEVLEDGVANISVVTTGDPGLDFAEAVEGVTCSGTTTPCVIPVTFHATNPGLRTGAVVVTDSNSGAILSVPLYGTGEAAEAGLSPAITSPPFGTDGFQDPTAVAVSGNGVLGEVSIFIADDQACVIWGANGGNFIVYAGTYATCGFSGDGGAASSAELGHPEDVALDGAGNLYIADAANGLIRKVDRGGTITTVAGSTGQSNSFSGDGGPATSAGLSDPNGVALDSAGNLSIADTNNNRVRKVDLGGIITTVAGSNQAGYSGDGGAATSAELNTPFGVRVDAAGNLFIADSHNFVIRKVDLTGNISTVAGNFAAGAGNSGDGGPATSAQLGFPIFVSVSAAGELFISDVDNSNVRRVDGSGKITTFAVPTPLPLDLVLDPTGNIAMIDPSVEALTLMARTISSGLDFGTTNVNTATAAQDETVTNIGNQPLIFASIAPPTGFNLGGPDTSCSTSSPLSVGIDCLLGVVFDPLTAGGFEDVVTLTDNSLGAAGAGTQTIGVTGTGVQPLTPTTTTLTASPLTAFVGQTVTLTATVSPVPTGGTLGSVDFCLGGTLTIAKRGLAQPAARSMRGWRTRAVITPAGSGSCGAGTLLGTVTVGANGTAVLAITSLPAGTDSITAIYSGNPTLDISTSDPATVTINPAATTTTTLAISPNPVFSGQSATLTGTAAPTPTVSPFGTITFCDSGSVGPTVARQSSHFSSKTGRVFGQGGQPNGNGSPCGLNASLGTGSVNAQGVGTLLLTSLTVGDHNIYAVYSGAVGSLGSVSNSVDEPVDAAYTVTAPQTAFTVGQGGAVTVNVTVPPLGGAFDNVVTMSATGLPTGATATFNPPTVTPGAAGAPTVMTVQLLTVAPANLPAAPTTRIPFLPTGATLALGCAFLFYLRATQRVVKRVLVFASLFLIATLLSACNGGFAGKPGTIPGNYVITITGTSGSLHPSTTVTITVQ
jgi:sugar lactone lactonase YvrE